MGAVASIPNALQKQLSSGLEQASVTIVAAFLGAEYEGGRHAKWVAMLTDIENGVADIGALAQQNIFRAGIF